MRRLFEPIPDPAGALVPPPRFPRTAVAAATPPPPPRRSGAAYGRARRPRRIARPRDLAAGILHAIADAADTLARTASHLAERVAAPR